MHTLNQNMIEEFTLRATKQILKDLTFVYKVISLLRCEFVLQAVK